MDGVEEPGARVESGLRPPRAARRALLEMGNVACLRHSEDAKDAALL